MKLIRRPIPEKKASLGNVFDDIVSAEMRQELKLSPGIQFQICTDDGRPLVMPEKRLGAFRGACKRPYRLTTRPAGKKSERMVWIANDPGYWERLDRSRAAKKGASDAA